MGNARLIVLGAVCLFWRAGSVRADYKDGVLTITSDRAVVAVAAYALANTEPQTLSGLPR